MPIVLKLKRYLNRVTGDNSIVLKIFIAVFLFSAAANVFAQNKPDNRAQAKLFLESLAKKDFQTAYGLFADEVKAKLPAEALPQVWAQVTGEYGEFRGIKELKKTADDESFIAVLEFSKKTENFAFRFNNQGKILGFTLAPTGETAKYETPKYADTNSFTESEVTVGAGEWALPATLTMPKDKKNVPAIVLVQGSGAHDRDEMIGNTKIFKDLAWALASRGIAVLRYDKRTLVHGKEMAALKNFTVNEETVDDALLAVELLRKTPNVDAKNIFVLGHSLGGMMIPRIGARDGKIAGLIVFAGATRPLEDAIVEQTEYLANLDGTVTKEEQARIDAYKQISAKIKSLTESDRDSGEFYYGAPASYYLDLRNYNAPQSAAKLEQPMLILQGENDYNVTMREFAGWKNALQSRKNVQFKSYPKLTHLFMEGAGGNPPGHVDETVISDIADWILKTANK
ncbi:MAG: alpha/beta hydrolase [Pyrinomonadaceae bacterium]